MKKPCIRVFLPLSIFQTHVSYAGENRNKVYIFHTKRSACAFISYGAEHIAKRNIIWFRPVLFDCNYKGEIKCCAVDQLILVWKVGPNNF